MDCLKLLTYSGFINLENIMSKLLNVAIAAALGFAVSAPLYAAETSDASMAKRTTALSDAQVRTAMDKCNNLTGTAHAKCIVNIRPTAAGDRVAMTTDSAKDDNVVKHGKYTEEEYSAAVKECESADTANRDRCLSDANQRFGRM